MRKVTEIPFDKESFEKMVHSSAAYSTFVNAKTLDEPTIDTGLENVAELKNYKSKLGGYIKLDV